MSGYRLVGLSSIAIGNYGATGLMGTTLTSITGILPDSATFAIPDPGDTKFFIEDGDYPDVTIANVSEPYIEFATVDMDPANFALAFGGTGAGTLFSASYTALDIRERSIRAIGKDIAGNQVSIDVPRASLRGNTNLQFARSTEGSIGFRADVMLPTTSAEAPWKIRIL